MVKPVRQSKPDSLAATLAARGKSYGVFAHHAAVTQNLKVYIRGELAAREKELTASQQESIDMICHKLGRIINGDPDHADSWHDIAGYAQLVADELNGKLV